MGNAPNQKGTSSKILKASPENIRSSWIISPLKLLGLLLHPLVTADAAANDCQSSWLGLLSSKPHVFKDKRSQLRRSQCLAVRHKSGNPKKHRSLLSARRMSREIVSIHLRRVENDLDSASAAGPVYHSMAYEVFFKKIRDARSPCSCGGAIAGATPWRTAVEPTASLHHCATLIETRFRRR